MRYEIQTWNQPCGNGYGWVRCKRSDDGARYFVFSTEECVRHDRVHGRDFASRALARAAIAKAEGK
jgi:hypothetical protein